MPCEFCGTRTYSGVHECAATKAIVQLETRIARLREAPLLDVSTRNKVDAWIEDHHKLRVSRVRLGGDTEYECSCGRELFGWAGEDHRVWIAQQFAAHLTYFTTVELLKSQSRIQELEAEIARREAVSRLRDRDIRQYAAERDKANEALMGFIKTIAGKPFGIPGRSMLRSRT